jgi:hypothetical protein
MRNLRFLSALLVLSCLIGAAKAQVQNGSFETNDVPGDGNWAYNYGGATADGWSLTGDSGIAYGQDTPWSAGGAENGDYVAFLQSTGDSGAEISQVIDFGNFGQTYTLSFWLSDRPDYPAAEVTASIGDGVATDITLTKTPELGAGTDDWTYYSGTFVQTDDDETLSFSTAVGDADNDTLLDHVSLVPGTVSSAPAPAALAPFAVGLLSLRRKRSK